MVRYNLQFFGGRGAGGGLLKDGPKGGSTKGLKWGQPNTPIVPPSASIRKQIGSKGEPIPADKAYKSVNPDRDVEYGDYSMNCQRCVVAYELNRRGYNVEASETYENDPYPRAGKWADAFKNPTFTKVGARTNEKVNANILKNMKEWGDNSRAIVRVQYNQRQGHVFNVEYNKGRLKYYDAQTGERYDPKSVFNHVMKPNVQIVRTDNLALNDDVRNMVRKKRSAR